VPKRIEGTLLISKEDRIYEEFCKRLCQVGIEHIHRVTEHPESLSKRLLEQKDSQESITFSSRRIKEKELFP
jgi:hypothetical protein